MLDIDYLNAREITYDVRKENRSRGRNLLQRLIDRVDGRTVVNGVDANESDVGEGDHAYFHLKPFIKAYFPLQEPEIALEDVFTDLAASDTDLNDRIKSPTLVY